MFSELEELDKSLLDLDYDLNCINFIHDNKISSINAFALLELNNIGVYSTNHILFPKTFTLLHSDNLFKFLSSKFRMKILLPIKVCFCYYKKNLFLALI